jgi:predicted HTH transcriptional regulator
MGVMEKESRIDIEELVSQGEQSTIEFKSALRTNLHTRLADIRIEAAIVKTIAGFLNASGGTLVIGVADDGTPVGLVHDRFESEDKLRLHLDNLIRDRMGPQYMMYVHPRFEEYKDTRVLAVECWPSDTAAYVKEGNVEKFFIRTGASTSELTPSQTVEYVKRRFRKS